MSKTDKLLAVGLVVLYLAAMATGEYALAGHPVLQVLLFVPLLCPFLLPMGVVLATLLPWLV